MSRPSCGLFIILALIGWVSCPLSVVAEADPVPRILVVGDSWAELTSKLNALQGALEARGLGRFTTEGETTALGGTTAELWSTPEYLGKIERALEAMPTIDIIHLSVSGNDMWAGDPRWPEARRARFLDSIEADIETIVSHCLQLDPALRVAMCGYDYLNLAETIDPESTTFNPHARMAWEKLGKPSPGRINQWFIELALRQRAVAARHERVAYVQNHGLCQVRLAPESFPATGMLPLPGQAPDYDPWPGGDPDRPSPPVAMWPISDRRIDWLHLSEAGYAALMENMVETVYEDWLHNPVATPAPASITPE